jgi:pseudaminic acid synthase
VTLSLGSSKDNLPYKLSKHRILNTKMSKTFIIAELSANHNNDLNHTLNTIYSMKESGADAVKIQTYRAESLAIDVVNEEFGPRKHGLWKGVRPYDLYKKGELPYEWYDEIFSYCKKLDITLFSSPFDLEAVDYLEKFECPIYKVASFEVQHIPLLKRISETNKPVIVSTGIAGISDIETALNILVNNEVTLLKCTSEYPALIEEANLNNMVYLKDRFNVNVGLSDHTLGKECALAAVAIGASVIEKHFILDKAKGGLDAEFSMEPAEFEDMVKSIRRVESALGNNEFKLSEGSLKSKNRGRKIYIARDVKLGELINESNVRVVRGSQGLEPVHYYDILGKRFSSDFRKGDPLDFDKVSE